MVSGSEAGAQAWSQSGLLYLGFQDLCAQASCLATGLCRVCEFMRLALGKMPKDNGPKLQAELVPPREIPTDLELKAVCAVFGVFASPKPGQAPQWDAGQQTTQTVVIAAAALEGESESESMRRDRSPGALRWDWRSAG
ncbi:hypothetical protein TREES_T100011907 [Tupaia chinensis]|uniref:Uncharacterized protein n=1 Tax=Tupaia chinensis TaxID=246437 RepID=L9KXU1_TUPCH|nr:hypothetical protein TREES_T100011907 [Tupaia chinensis]